MDDAVSLREYFDARLSAIDDRINDRDKRIELALAAAKEAVTKAELADDKRFGLLNEFRGQSADESRKYAQTALVEATINGVLEKVDAVAARVARNENAIATLHGRSMALAGFGALFGGVIATLVARAFG